MMKSPSPTFSVLIPLYNKEQFVTRAIDSVIKQDFQSFEIIIVDDCSTDSSLSIVESFQDTRINIIKNQHNMGPSASRNIGIDNSNGKYLVFFDSDDVMSTHYLSALLSGINTYPNISVFSTSFTHNLDAARNITNANIDWQRYPLFSYQREILRGARLLTASSFCCKKEVFIQIEKFNESLLISEDPEFFCRLSSKFEICHSEKKFIFYDISLTDSLSRKPIKKIPFAYLETMKEICLEFKDKVLDDYFYKISLKIFILMKKDFAPNSQLHLIMKYSKQFNLQRRVVFHLINSCPNALIQKLFLLRKS